MSDHVTKQMKRKHERRERAHLRVRSRVQGTTERPRLSIYKSAKFIYAQVIDDSRGVTLAQANSADPEVRNALASANAGGEKPPAENPEGNETGHGKKAAGAGSQVAAKLVGEKIAERAKAVGVAKVVFDRGGYIYHGKVKAVAEGAREKGLQF
jgi:large subunit ribosomal protein L18